MSSESGFDLSELRAFGTAVDKFQRHGVGVGGQIVLQRSPLSSPDGGKEEIGRHEQREAEGPEEARPQAGAREGQGPPPAGGAAAAQAVQRELTVAFGLEELLGYYPGWRWSSGSAGLGYLHLPVHPFATLPYRASLTLELPTDWPFWLFAPVSERRNQDAAPHIRCWARWHYGVPVRSHHAYPDGSMCIHSPGEWLLTGGRLVHYVAMAVLWIGKSLHLQLLGRWPGQQHYESAHIRLRRDAQEEYCGCGSDKIYRLCCRQTDLATPARKRIWWLYRAERRYLREITRRHWPVHPMVQRH